MNLMILSYHRELVLWVREITSRIQEIKQQNRRKKKYIDQYYTTKNSRVDTSLIVQERCSQASLCLISHTCSHQEWYLSEDFCRVSSLHVLVKVALKRVLKLCSSMCLGWWPCLMAYRTFIFSFSPFLHSCSTLSFTFQGTLSCQFHDRRWGRMVPSCDSLCVFSSIQELDGWWLLWVDCII